MKHQSLQGLKSVGDGKIPSKKVKHSELCGRKKLLLTILGGSTAVIQAPPAQGSSGLETRTLFVMLRVLVFP